ncbi:uncharacterized protein LOC131693136 [Topomyia yanbarensis]|uniref:uncharacterized protein LOC131693136 n=1 Tax=Topomyia yanbarensis TaxID=2498891 RepID=UPI00273BDF55|nr:uncharacterized protein LOC131693136 [Topomyia yanbarensis]
MSLSITVLLLVAIVVVQCFAGIPRTYDIRTEEERYGQYERVLLGLSTSEGLSVDSKLLAKVREVLFEDEASQSTEPGKRVVAVQLEPPKQSREIAQLLYKNRRKY